MALQQSTIVRNARLDAIENAIGTSAILRLRSGAPPASCAAADTGTVIATIQLPSDYLLAASGGSKAKSGTWEDVAADAAGIVGHFRFYDSAGTTCHMQGTVTASGGSGDMTIDNTNVATGQDVIITAFQITAANA